MSNVRFGSTLPLLFSLVGTLSAVDTTQACSLQFTSPARGSTVMSATVGVSGTGSGTANPGDLGQVTATLNGRVFFQRSGVFTSLLQFLGSGAASVTLQPGANLFSVQGSAGSCSASDSMVVYYTPPPPPEKKGSGPPRECNGSNPICGGTGNKYQREIDYLGAGVFPLRFERHYNSAWPEERALGARWRSHYDRELATTATQAAITRPEGQAFLFNLVGGVWTPEIDVTERLERLTDVGGVLIGWRYTTNTDETERYDAQGRLVAITNRQGFTQTLAYDAQGRLATVTDPAGRTLRFTYDETQRLRTMTDPAGGVYSYRYDGKGNLASVGYPDATPADRNDDPTRGYHYEDPRFPHHLTGLTDENGERFATWAYDATGRGVLSEHAGGAGRVIFTYHPDGSTTVTDALGRARTYSFDTLHSVPKLTSLNGGPCTNCGLQARDITYDARGFVASRTDFNGHTTLYSHDARGLERSRTEALGTPEARTITTEWHPSFRLPITITEPGKESTFTYDAAGRLLVRIETDPTTGATRATTHTYNDLGLLETVDGPRTDVGDVTRFTYDARGDLVSITDALGHLTQITARDAHGRPLAIRDPNGTVTALTYDPRGRLLSRTVDGQPTSFDYDAAGNLLRAMLPNGAFLQHTYDAAHRSIAMEDNLGNRIDYTLDPLGNRIREDVKDPGGTLRRTQFRVYNEINRLVQNTSGENQTTLYAYDANGNPVSITDPNGNATTQGFDALNRRIETTDTFNGVTSFTYDPRDHSTAMTDPRGLTTTYTYDGLDNLIQQISPDTGTTTYTYDTAGNPTSRTDARGVTVHYSYDALNRLTTIDYPDDGLDVVLTHDRCTNGIGRLCEMRDGSGTTIYAYDLRGNLTTQTATVGGVTQTVVYAYNGADQLIRITYPSGRTVDHARDVLGRITLVATNLDGVSQTLAGDIEYQPFGPMASLAYGNGIPLVHTFDLDHRLTAQTAGAAQVLAFRLDPNGNITGITNPLDPNRNQAFGYDALDRLSEAHGRYGDLGYTYDAAGNRLSRTRNGITEPYTYAADSHHLLQSMAGGTRNYRYDANGNTTDNTDYGFVYGDHDWLTAVTQAGLLLASYTYNGRGERVRKAMGEETPDYAALAREQEALAAAHRSDAERTEAQARALEHSARASETQAASKQGEADTLRQTAAAHRTKAEGLDRQAALREQYATPWRTLAQSLRSRIVEPPEIRYNACSMPSTGP
jgi:YD repeat-containing protein